MNAIERDLKQQLKQRLLESISAQIDAIGYVPEDIAKLIGHHAFETSTADASPPAPQPDSGAGREALATRVNAYYDTAFFSRDGIMGVLLGDTQYRNIGFWGESTKTQHEASKRLQDALLDLIPEKTGRVLDVACGLGASTRRLLDFYAPENVYAINISEKQIESARKNAPGCNAMVMNATAMTFESEFFDAILCIEAAFHFETRRKFLEDALRILKPGGRLVLSDVLFTSRERFEQYPVLPTPENHVATVEDYRTLLADIGYRDIRIDDVSEKVWRPHFLHFVNRIHEEFYEGRLSLVELTDMLWTYYQLNAVTGPCIFVSAQK